MKLSLSAELARLDGLLPVKAPRVAAKLAPPASAETLAHLAEAAFGGTLPSDLTIWFGWHDGQAGSSAISPDNNYMLHSVASALESRKLLSSADAQAPWDPNWFPLMENGAGDHLVYAGGVILEYRHDDAERPVRWPSLAQWAKVTAGLWAKVTPKKVPPPAEYRWEPAESLLGWEAGVKLDQSALPNLGSVYRNEIAALTAQPVGTVLSYSHGMTYLFVKLAANRWLYSFDRSSEAAIAQWRDFSSKPPSEKSGYYKTDEDVWSTLSSYFRGAPAPTLQRGIEI